MNKQLLVSTFIAGALILGGAGCQENQMDQSSTLTTPTPEVLVTSTPEVSTTTTTSLIDRPVNEWPRYEFKELGFSMQLPFVSSSLSYGFNYCRYCMVTTTYQYTGAKLSMTKDPQYMFMGSYSQDYEYDRDADLTDIKDLELGPSPKLIFFGRDSYKLPIKPLKHLYHQNTEIVIFDGTGFYRDMDIARGEKRWAFTFRLPTSKKFRAVLFTFGDKDLPFSKISQVIQTIDFKRY